MSFFSSFRPQVSLAERVLAWMMPVLFFLIPMFFLPWSSEILEQNKQALFVLVSLIGIVLWFGNMAMRKKTIFSIGWIQIVPALFLGFVLVSSLFSVMGYQTWVGNNMQEYTSFLTTACLVLFYYLLANNAEEVGLQKKNLVAFLFSAFLIGLSSVVFLVPMVRSWLPFLPSGFNTIGNMNALAAFLSAASFVGLSAWLVSYKKDRAFFPSSVYGWMMRALVFLLVVCSLIFLLAIDYWMLWVMNIVGVLVLATFGFVQTDEFPSTKRFFLPLLILLVSLLFLFLPSPLTLPIPTVVVPSFSASWGVVTSTFNTSVKNVFLGSGPGTFKEDFLLHKPLSLNQSRFWDLGFDRATSYFLTLLTTMGVLTVLAWVVFVLWLGAKTVKRLLKERQHEDWKVLYVLFVGWVMVFMGQCISASNMTFAFLFWGFSGMLAAHVLTHVWKSDFREIPLLGLFTSCVFIMTLVGVIVSFCLVGQKLGAEYMFVQAAQSQKAAKPLSQTMALLETAQSWNPFFDTYKRRLSSAYLAKAEGNIAELKGKQPTPEQSKDISSLVTKALETANKATATEPNRVENWLALGLVYERVMPYIQNAEDQAAKAYLHAIQLDPKNPAYQTQLGHVYLLVADRAHAMKSSKDADTAKKAGEQEVLLLKNAEQILNSAIKTKADYLPAHYYLAAVYERSGRLSDAVNRLVALRNQTPNDVGLGFQLAQLWTHQKKYAEARAELERITKLSPDYANALWSLASLYEQVGDPTKAQVTIKKILEKNPDNAQVQERLKKMEAGENTSGFGSEPLPQETTENKTP